MEKQRIETRSVNYVNLMLRVELGHEVDEYTIELTGILGNLDIWTRDGADDISLIRECIESNINELKLPKEGWVDVVLKESGEWQDVFWCKWYEIERVVVNELSP